MKHVHYVPMKLKNGTRWYIYAWRGGPKIDVVDSDEKPRLTLKQKQAIEEAHDEQSRPGETIDGLMRDWQASREWKAFAQGTQDTWSVWTRRIETRWKGIPLKHFSNPKMVARIVDWRDDNADTHGTRAADIGMTVLTKFLEWGRMRGRVTINVAQGIPSLHRYTDRSEIIWLPEEIEAFNAAAPQDVRDIMLLAQFTGMRRADLAAVKPQEVGEYAIVRTAKKKSRGKRQRATVPIIEPLRPSLEAWKDRPTLLLHNGKPWHVDTMGKAFHRVRDEIGAVHVDDEGNELPKHLHDLRGTFVTHLCRAGLTDSEIADIVAWSPANVCKIRKRYVDDAAVVVAIGRRISAAL